MTRPKYTTFTGVKAEEIPAKLSERFTPEAYKGVPGGADLTDINTGFMIERITQVFGPKGLGWNLIYDPASLRIGDGNRPLARIDATFTYALWDDKDQRLDCAFQVSGVNQNDAKYVEEGARTSAVGAAIKWLCFQVEIYKGQFDHHDAEDEKKAAAAAARVAAGTNGRAAANATKPAPEDNDEVATADWGGITKYQEIFGKAVKLGIKADSVTPGKTTKGEVRAMYAELVSQVEKAQAAAAK